MDSVSKGHSGSIVYKLRVRYMTMRFGRRCRWILHGFDSARPRSIHKTPLAQRVTTQTTLAEPHID